MLSEGHPAETWPHGVIEAKIADCFSLLEVRTVQTAWCVQAEGSGRIVS
jgi:hypothetical protein